MKGTIIRTRRFHKRPFFIPSALWDCYDVVDAHGFLLTEKATMAHARRVLLAYNGVETPPLTAWDAIKANPLEALADAFAAVLIFIFLIAGCYVAPAMDEIIKGGW